MTVLLFTFKVNEFKKIPVSFLLFLNLKNTISSYVSFLQAVGVPCPQIVYKIQITYFAHYCIAYPLQQVFHREIMIFSRGPMQV